MLCNATFTLQVGIGAIYQDIVSISMVVAGHKESTAREDNYNLMEVVIADTGLAVSHMAELPTDKVADTVEYIHKLEVREFIEHSAHEELTDLVFAVASEVKLYFTN